jgi:hypothetical protein
MKRVALGSSLIIALFVLLAASAPNALAALTFSDTTMSGSGAVSIDGASTISIGTSAATGVVIGNSSTTAASITSGGGLTLTAGAPSTWDVNGTLSLNTIHNGAITVGTGLLTASGGLTLASGTTLTLTGDTVTGAPTWSSSQAITLSTASQPNITSLGTLTSLNISGAISGATSTNTLNGAVINGSTQTFGSHTITDSGVLAINSASASNLTLDSAGGTSTVNVGTTNATTVAIGRTGQTLQLKGVTTPAANGVLYIKDADGGIEETAASTGIQCLQTSGSGTAPTWGACGGSNNFTAAQDLSGSATSQTVVGIQGNPVSSTTPLTNQVLTWSGSAWAPQNSANQWTTANGGCVPTTYTVSYTDNAFETASTAASETLFSLSSSRQKLCGAVLDPQIAFASGSVSTVTVAAGINTPASTVILAEQEFLGEDGRPLTVAEYKNMAGRAGRLGYHESGRAIILADGDVSPTFLLHKYVLADPEPITSSFDSNKPNTWLIRLLSQVKEVPRQDVVKLLSNTYGGFLAERQNPNWRSQISASLEALLAQMIELGLAEEQDGLVRLTLLGQVCGRSSLSFASSLRLIRSLRENHGPMTAEQLLVAIQALPECDDVYTPLMKRGLSEERWPRELANTYGGAAASALQAGAADMNMYRARCKRAMVIRSWIAGAAMQQIEQDATTNPYQGKISSGHVRQFADAARFNLRAAHEISSLVLVNLSPTPQDIEALLCRLEFGVPANLVPLVQSLPTPIQRGDLLALGRAGIHTVEALWTLTAEALIGFLGKEPAQRLERYRPQP